MWLKVLIALLVSLMLLSFGFTTTKVDKDTLRRHEEYEKERFDGIMEYLIRIDESTKRGKL
jgi:hypothetical protein